MNTQQIPQLSQITPSKYANSQPEVHMFTNQVTVDTQSKKHKKIDKQNHYGNMVKQRIKAAGMIMKDFNIFGCNESIFESQTNINYESNKENSHNSFRNKYRIEILKYLIFGYLQIMHELDVKRVLDEEIDLKTVMFIKNIESMERAVQFLKQKSIQIEEWMFKLYNLHVHEGVESKMYRFQFVNLLRNLADPDNLKFREETIMEVNAPEIVAMMNELDMMEPRKKEYILTKNKSLLDQKKTRKLLINREDKYEAKKKLLASKEVMQTKKCLNFDSCGISYFLSNEVVNDMELDLMEIPFKAIRKIALANLNKTFYS